MIRLLLAVALTTALLLPPAPTAAGARFARLSRPRIVAIVRHAHAPGTGDPTRFALDDCTTQRNLGVRGRGPALTRRGFRNRYPGQAPRTWAHRRAAARDRAAGHLTLVGAGGLESAPRTKDPVRAGAAGPADGHPVRRGMTRRRAIVSRSSPKFVVPPAGGEVDARGDGRSLRRA